MVEHPGVFGGFRIGFCGIFRNGFGGLIGKITVSEKNFGTLEHKFEKITGKAIRILINIL